MLNAHLVLSVLLNQFDLSVRGFAWLLSLALFRKNIALLFLCTVAVFWMVFAGMAGEIRREGWRPFTLRFFSRSRRFRLGLSGSESLLDSVSSSCVRVSVARRKGLGHAVGGGDARAAPTAPKILTAAAAGALGRLTLGIAWNFVANKDRSRQRRPASSAPRSWRKSDKPTIGCGSTRRRTRGPWPGRTASFTSTPAAKQWPRSHCGAPARTIQSYMHEDFAHMTDVAAAIGASYWLASPDDSDKQWVEAKPFLAERFGEIEKRPSGTISQQRRSCANLCCLFSDPELGLSRGGRHFASRSAPERQPPVERPETGWTRNPARNAALPWICLAGTLVLFLLYLPGCIPPTGSGDTATMRSISARRRPWRKGAVTSFRVFREIRPKQNIRCFIRGCFPRSGSGTHPFLQTSRSGFASRPFSVAGFWWRHSSCCAS